ncbi:uncharacterized protein DDB_G0283697-like [Contarinia nasturtii]|uniref:uncharacterized protein DDB_G0283697-like n=1 Tax=Contarinia nasturtii TaxID=265458 RepID=UPI0012D4298C|nr:uncharacterized protein DDB_G0283697-like [Contarinia nasturtii]
MFDRKLFAVLFIAFTFSELLVENVLGFVGKVPKYDMTRHSYSPLDFKPPPEDPVLAANMVNEIKRQINKNKASKGRRTGAAQPSPSSFASANNNYRDNHYDDDYVRGRDNHRDNHYDDRIRDRNGEFVRDRNGDYVRSRNDNYARDDDRIRGDYVRDRNGDVIRGRNDYDRDHYDDRSRGHTGNYIRQYDDRSHVENSRGPSVSQITSKLEKNIRNQFGDVVDRVNKPTKEGIVDIPYAPDREIVDKIDGHMRKHVVPEVKVRINFNEPSKKQADPSELSFSERRSMYNSR